MKRLFLISDDNDFTEWIEEELAEYGRFVRSLDSLDFFFPQWKAAGSVDVIILPETVIVSEEAFLKMYETVKSESPETRFLFIYHREEDHILQSLNRNGNVCVNYNELDTGLLEERLVQSDKYVSPLRQVQQQSPEKEAPKTQRYQPESINEFDHTHVDDDSVEANKLFAPIRPPATELTVEHVPAPTKRKREEEPESSQPETERPRKKRTTDEQKEKLQRIKGRIIIEEKIVTVHVPVHFNSLLVSVISLYPRAGATFVTSNFALMLGENKVPVAVLEPVLEMVGSTYYELMYGDKNAPKDWVSWAEQLQSQGYIKQENVWSKGGVTWIPSSVEPIQNWTEEQTMKLLLAAKRYPVTLCDVSSNYNDPQCQKILSMSDEIWIVTDGDPIQLSHHYRTIDHLKSEYPGKNLKVVGNRWNRYIKQAEWKEAVSLPSLTLIPDLGGIVLKHMWNGKMVWEDEKLKNILAVPFKPLARTVMAKEMYHLIKKQYGLRAKVGAFFKQMKSLDDETKAKQF
jgi:hypothetical protein